MFSFGLSEYWLKFQLLCLLTGSVTATSSSLYEFVDPLIGTVGSIPGSSVASGNAFPGAALPWGMAKAGIDTSYIGIPNGTATDANAGFSPLGNVTAISVTHVSGTGGAPTCNLDAINLADNTTYWQNRSLETETATVGMFQTHLLNGIGISIAATNHTGFIRYSFPRTEDVHVMIDLTHVLPSYDIEAYTQKYQLGDLHLRPAANATQSPSYFGSATYTGGWVQSQDHKLFFCGNFSVPPGSSLRPTSNYVQPSRSSNVIGAGTFSWPYDHTFPPAFSDRPFPLAYDDIRTYTGGGMGIGALFSWAPDLSSASHNETSTLEARIGISYISAEQACSHIEKELPPSQSFEDTVEQARTEWENKVLSTIKVVDDGSASSSNKTLKRMLYTALYHSALMPTDKTFENPRWTSNDGKPYYDDFYTLWDTYRTLQPLYHLIFTPTYTRIISGLISIFSNEGYLPIGRAANWNGRVQGGTHAEMVLTDAFLKSVGSVNSPSSVHELNSSLIDIDWETAYRAMVKDANILPDRNADSVAPDGATKEGRGALDEYIPLHFITRNHTRSISRGLEYSQNDHAIYTVAVGLNKSADEIAKYRERASWWQNQWNPYANTSLAGVGNFTGFPGARNSDGGWNFTDYDPLTCANCGWGGDIYEAKVWETGFAAAPHDMRKLIELMGGDEKFVERLDASFLPGFGGTLGNANNDAGSALYNPGNEPSFMTSFLYNYVPGSQWKTVNQSRSIVDQFYSDAVSGYPGNIDSGALPSWLIFNLIGLYPIASQPIYLLSAPFFSHLNISLFPSTPSSTTLQIVAQNLSATNFYPQSVELNGKMLDRSWVAHDEINNGGTLVFEMGSQPGKWDTGDRPPSMDGW